MYLLACVGSTTESAPPHRKNKTPGGEGNFSLHLTLHLCLVYTLLLDRTQHHMANKFYTQTSCVEC